MNCIICGCHWHCACSHSTAGNCHWHVPGLCSHCADPKIFVDALRPLKNVKYRILPLTPTLLKNALASLGLHVVITAHKNKKRYKGTFSVDDVYEIMCVQGDREKYTAIIKAWFPNCEQWDIKEEGVYLIKPSETLPQIEANTAPVKFKIHHISYRKN
jgi:hypothetical protein